MEMRYPSWAAQPLVISRIGSSVLACTAQTGIDMSRTFFPTRIAQSRAEKRVVKGSPQECGGLVTASADTNGRGDRSRRRLRLPPNDSRGFLLMLFVVALSGNPVLGTVEAANFSLSITALLLGLATLLKKRPFGIPSRILDFAPVWHNYRDTNCPVKFLLGSHRSRTVMPLRDRLLHRGSDSRPRRNLRASDAGSGKSMPGFLFSLSDGPSTGHRHCSIDQAVHTFFCPQRGKLVDPCIHFLYCSAGLNTKRGDVLGARSIRWIPEPGVGLSVPYPRTIHQEGLLRPLCSAVSVPLDDEIDGRLHSICSCAVPGSDGSNTVRRPLEVNWISGRGLCFRPILRPNGKPTIHRPEDREQHLGCNISHRELADRPHWVDSARSRLHCQRPLTGWGMLDATRLALNPELIDESGRSRQRIFELRSNLRCLGPLGCGWFRLTGRCFSCLAIERCLLCWVYSFSLFR